MITVVTGRFNTETLNSNYEYRKKYGFQCLYCCPWELSPKILYDTPVFVIEMNNSTNKIEGIGLIKNLGKELFTTYVVPFEISSVLFLSAMVGAVVIGKKE